MGGQRKGEIQVLEPGHLSRKWRRPSLPLKEKTKASLLIFEVGLLGCKYFPEILKLRAFEKGPPSEVQ